VTSFEDQLMFHFHLIFNILYVCIQTQVQIKSFSLKNKTNSLDFPSTQRHHGRCFAGPTADTVLFKGRPAQTSCSCCSNSAHPI